MFKKSSKRNLRQRGDSEDEANRTEAPDEDAVVNIAVLKAQRGKRQTKSKLSNNISRTPKSVLSFANEDEDGTETFKTKKSSRSSRIARHIKKLNQEEKSRTAQNGNVGYTAEDLNELRKLSVRPEDSHAPKLQSENISSFSTDESADSKYSGIVTGGWIKPGDIPDANRIHAARKQREMMRKYGSDYIPIETKKFGREDEEMNGSDSDEEPTLEMKGIIDDGVRVINQIGSDGEGDLHRDEEFDLWEAEVIKKGISTQQPTATVSSKNESAPKSFGQALHKGPNASFQAHSSTSTSVSKTSVVPHEATKRMKERITERLSALQQVHSSHKQHFGRATLDVKESEKSASTLDLTTLSTQYSYFQDMRAYIADLVDCLTEKKAEIDSLEERRYKIWKKKADAITARRQKDMEDESSDISMVMSGSKIMPVVPTDEKQARIREREGRRSYRRAMRQRAGNYQHTDGMSTDDEESSTEKAEHYMEMQQIENVKNKLFEDVLEEFSNVKIILSKFEEWMEKYPQSYKDAYIDLCVPKVLCPFVRLASLEWNPLEAGCIPTERMFWFQDLMFFGVKRINAEYQAKYGNPNSKILSNLIDKVFFMKITHIVKEVWDPLSRTQTLRLSSLLCKFADTYPCMRSDNRRCGDLLLALCSRIQYSVERDAFIPLYPTSVLTSVSSARAFFERRSWTCIKLFQNILAFHKTLSQTALTELAFTLLLNRYIMLSLQTSPITATSVYKCQCIAEAIPCEWLKNPDSLSNCLEPFSRYLLYCAKHIHDQIDSCNDSGKQRVKYCVAQLGKILLCLGFNDMSQNVAELLAEWSTE